VERSNRLLLAKARRIDAPVVVLHVVAEPERTAEAIAGLEALGGVLGASELSAGSLRLSMPTENVERAAALPAVTSMTIEQVPPRGATRQSSPPPR